MLNLRYKTILLGVCGGIAAYKSAYLLRELQKQGAEVRVIMTRAAHDFITPLTFQALSGHVVYTDDYQSEQRGMEHIDLARWANAIVIAPATANFLARLAQGRAEDLLSSLCLAANIPLAVAPAMNREMWAQAATQANVELLRQRDITFFGPDSNEQACGETGDGRMLEPDVIVSLIANKLFSHGELAGKTIVVTAGPTHEAIDPVRFIANRSSGKMGYAVAQAAQEAGANVILVSGPTALQAPAKVKVINVVSAENMLQQVQNEISHCDIFISVAAVSDYRAATNAPQKLKKQETLTLELVKNPDILATIAEQHSDVFCVGFAAETNNVKEYALTKLQQKKLQLIVANQVSADAASVGFESDDNVLEIFGADGSHYEWERANKSQLARRLISLISEKYHAQHTS